MHAVSWRSEIWQSLVVVKQWLQLRFDFDWTAVRLPFDCNSTALRPFEELRYPCNNQSTINQSISLIATLRPESRTANDVGCCIALQINN